MLNLIKAQMQTAVPFVGTLAIRIEDISSGKATATLDQQPQISNHVGSMHAGAMFTLGETASGAAMSGAFASKIMTITPLAAEASIQYLKIAKGKISAHGEVSSPVASLLEALDQEGVARFNAHVVMKDEADEVVATMDVKWVVRDKEAAAKRNG